MMKVFGNGRFVRDPELRRVGDTCVCEFALAINEYRKVNGEKKKISSFLDFQVWDRGAEVIAEYCRKGDNINVTATPRQDKWEDKATGQNRSKIIFRIDEFELLGGRRKEEDQAESQPQSSSEEGEPF